MNLFERRVAVLVGDFYQELEVWYPIYRLREAGVRVVTVGTGEKETFPSKLGYPCTVELRIGEARTGDFDGVVIPGGGAPDFLRRSPAVVQFVADLDRAGKVIACICHGGWVLCSARILQGRRVTSFSAIKDDLINAGGLWVDEEVVVDRNLITSRKPDDLPAFMIAMLKALQNDE
jgi:protease I